jgi:hypothetical protein
VFLFLLSIHVYEPMYKKGSYDITSKTSVTIRDICIFIDIAVRFLHDTAWFLHGTVCFLHGTVPCVSEA